MCELSVVHSDCVNRFVTSKEFPCKWFRVTQYHGLWRFSTLLLVSLSNNSRLSAQGLTVVRPRECLSLICRFAVVFPPPDKFSIFIWHQLRQCVVRVEMIYCIIFTYLLTTFIFSRANVSCGYLMSGSIIIMTFKLFMTDLYLLFFQKGTCFAEDLEALFMSAPCFHSECLFNMVIVILFRQRAKIVWKNCFLFSSFP